MKKDREEEYNHHGIRYSAEEIYVAEDYKKHYPSLNHISSADVACFLRTRKRPDGYYETGL